jgi:MFS family permease
VSPYACFAVTLVCLTGAALLVLRVRRPLQAPQTGSRVPARPLREIAEAVRFIRARPRVASLVTVKSAVGLGNGVLAAFPVLAAVFGLGAIATGLLFAARGLGVIFGPFLFRRVLEHRDWLMAGLAISMISYGIAYLGVAVTPWFWLVLVGVALAHVSGGGNWVMSSYALQLAVPDHLRGRVFSTDQMIVSLSISLSVLLAGFVVDAFDARAAIALCGGLTLAYGVVWHLVTRRILRTETTPVATEPATP